MERYTRKFAIFTSWHTRKGMRWGCKEVCDTLASANCECRRLNKLGYHAYIIPMNV